MFFFHWKNLCWNTSSSVHSFALSKPFWIQHLIQLCEAPLPQKISYPNLLTLIYVLLKGTKKILGSCKICYKGIRINSVKPFVPKAPFIYPLTLQKFTRCLKTQKTLGPYLIKYIGVNLANNPDWNSLHVIYYKQKCSYKVLLSFKTQQTTNKNKALDVPDCNFTEKKLLLYCFQISNRIRTKVLMDTNWWLA